jgi:hypothetical protein
MKKLATKLHEGTRRKEEDGKMGKWEVKKVRNSKMRLKDSKPFFHANSNALYSHQHFNLFAAGSVQLKKPSGGPKGLIGPPCHGAPWPPEAKKSWRSTWYMK